MSPTRFPADLPPLASLGLLLIAPALLLAGCGGVPPPLKTIQVPAGGTPVLITAERAAAAEGGQPLSVAPALFTRPLERLPPEPQLKPFDEWTEQEAAADALGRIGSAAVPALVQALQSERPEVRRKAADVLGRMGGDAKDAVPDLMRLLNDPDPAVRKAAARTLGRIGPDADAAVPALMRSLLEPELKPPAG